MESEPSNQTSLFFWIKLKSAPQKRVRRRKINPLQTPSGLPRENKQSQNDQTDRQKGFKTLDESELNTDCWDNVINGAKHTDHRENGQKALVKFQQMWDRRLERFDDIKHPLKLTSKILRCQLCPSSRYTKGTQIWENGNQEKASDECCSAFPWSIGYRKLNAMTDKKEYTHSCECMLDWNH